MLKYAYIAAGVLIVAALFFLIGKPEAPREYPSTTEEAASVVDPGSPDRSDNPADTGASVHRDGITVTKANQPPATKSNSLVKGEPAARPARPDAPTGLAEITPINPRPERTGTPRAEKGPLPVASTKSTPANARSTQVSAGGDAESERPVHSLDFERPYFLPVGQQPVQSPARPLDLETIGEVEASVDDPGYVSFMEDVLPEVTPELEKHFKERKAIEEGSLEATLEDLKLNEDSFVRVYFIKEGTVFHNSLGISLEDGDKLIFPNASSVVSYFKDADTRKELTSEDIPMLPGDYVDLGLMKEGSLVDLFLIKDGARNPDGPIYGLDKEANHDKKNHVRIHQVVDDHTMIIGFEDLPGGGDRDYNDLVIAVEMIPAN